MAAEWHSIRLGDVCTKIGSGATPRGGKDVYLTAGPYALVRSQNVYNDGFRHGGLAYLNEQHADQLRNVEIREGDVLLNITGDSVARSCQVDASILPARVNQHVAIIRPDGNELDSGFLRYWLVTSETQAMLLSWAGSGGTRNALTKGMIESFEIVAPKEIDEQRAIAHILSTLDDKIELNRRMNETLEAMARALFKSWFVDFDPVRAKAEGRDPGLPKPLADLFPDRLVSSELGEVPEGWTCSPLAAWVDMLSGGTPPKKNDALWNGEIPWISPKSMSSIHADEPEHFVAEEAIGNGTRLAPDGSTLIMVRGMGLHDHVRVSQARCNVAFNQDVKALVAKEIPPVLVFLSVLNAQAELLGRVESSGHGTGKLPTEILGSHLIAMPPATERASLAKPLDHLNERIGIGRRETRALGAIRDTLLPQLISGELRVRSAERVAAESVA